jgi:hypothetical protein
MNTKRLGTALVTVAAGLTFASNSHAQSVDALLDKLVDKGVLSVNEANQLREESDKNFNTALSAKMGLPEWVSSLKFTGDIRGRFEHFSGENDAFKERNRFRYRMRFGFIATLLDDFEAGFRLSSSEASGTFGGDPISSNTSFQDNGSKKFVYIDLAYGKWSPIHGPHFGTSFTVGKMENPFVFSDTVFDADYTPEGIAIQSTYRFNDVHTAKLNLGAFSLDEIGGAGDDPYLYGAQLRLDSTWSTKLQTSIGAAWLGIGEEDFLSNASVPNVNRGNTREPFIFPPGTTNAVPSSSFGVFAVDASLTFTLEKAPLYAGMFPIKISADYIHNTQAAGGTDDHGYSAGITFGKAGKRRTWEISYTYRWLGSDAWWEELVDSDFGAYYGGTLPNSGLGSGYGAGTNIKGHIFRAAYSPSDSFTFSIKWLLTEAIDPFPAGSESQMNRLQVDALWRF